LDDSKEHQNVKSALVRAWLITWSRKFRNTIKFHDEHSPEKISQIMLCGGSAKLLHLTSYLYQQLVDLDHIDILLGNPWVNLFDPKDPNSAPMSREDSLSYTTAIGLAMRALEMK
jgi:Tfp pilus assembly PilM family ATPase